MAARIESDIEDSEVENEQDNYASDSGSDISVSTVNTEDLSDLSFSEDVRRNETMVLPDHKLWQ